MSERRYTADGKAGRFAHELRVCFSDRLANEPLYFLLADAVISAGYHDHCFATRLDAEDDRLRDLGDRTANREGRIRAGARRLIELHDSSGYTCVSQQRLDAE